MVDLKLKRRALHRAKIIEGQMRGLTSAIDKEQYCIDLLRHSLSISRALQSLNRLLFENHLRSHVRHQMKQKRAEEKAIREVLEIFTLSEK